MGELDDQRLVTVAERTSEAEAQMLVSVLADEGIRAVATGGFTADFRAEAPGFVRVQTLESDAPRAREIIASLRRVDEPWDTDQPASDEVPET